MQLVKNKLGQFFKLNLAFRWTDYFQNKKGATTPFFDE